MTDGVASSRRRVAFSLVELLVVIAVIGILLVLVVPAFHGIGNANALTSAGAMVVGKLENARNLALARTEPVELRFVKLPGEGGVSEEYRAIQLFRANPPEPLGTIQRLPTGMIAVDGAGAAKAYSTITAPAPVNPLGGDMLLQGATRSYRAVRFLPDGSTTLDALGAENGADRWFISLKFENAPAKTDRPADNFVTVVVDPITGRATAYRP